VKVGVGECNSELDLILRIKINLLLDWIASEDVETQQKGVVIVVWPSDPPNPTSRNSNNNNSMANSSASSSGSESEGESNWEGFLRPKLSKNDLANHNRYYHAQPIRIAAIHWCSQDKPIYRVLNSLYYFSLDSKSQSRYKVHYGEQLEIRYKLQAFGIPVDLLPLTHTMALKRHNHLQWIACRKYIDDQQQYHQKQQQQQQQHKFQQRKFQWDDERAFFDPAADISSASSTPQGQIVVVECPRSYDVIIGKAKVCANNPGNGFYSSLIEATHDEHDSLTHARDKVAMTWRILIHITEARKGRFLDWNKELNAWVVIQDRIVVRKKIANSYKEYKRSRYVTRAGNSSSSNNNKKKHEPDGGNGSNAGNNTGTNTKKPISSTLAKRRKTTNGCFANGESGNERGTESMFAGL